MCTDVNLQYTSTLIITPSRIPKRPIHTYSTRREIARAHQTTEPAGKAIVFGPASSRKSRTTTYELEWLRERVVLFSARSGKRHKYLFSLSLSRRPTQKMNANPASIAVLKHGRTSADEPALHGRFGTRFICCFDAAPSLTPFPIF